MVDKGEVISGSTVSEGSSLSTFV